MAALTQTTGKRPPVREAWASLLLGLVHGRFVAVSISPEI